ncbi:lipopolysaccharide biosynthesis protein [Aliikangiella sp. IMCC44653]
MKMLSWLIILKDKILKSTFFSSVILLIGGTVVAQILGVLALPIITRIYSPENFNEFAVFLSLLSICSVSSCLRFEIAIPTAETDDEAFDVFVLALSSCFIISCVLFLIALFTPVELFISLGGSALVQVKNWVPLGVLLICIFGAVQYWAIREKQFSIIAKSRMLQASSYVGLQIVLGIIQASGIGLILGSLAGNASASINLFRRNISKFKSISVKISIRKLKNTFAKYKNYPKFSSLEALTNTAAVELPILLIAGYTAGPTAGYLLLATRVMGAPISLIGTAISQVYLATAPETYRTGSLPEFTKLTIYNLLKIAVVPLALVGFFAPYYFPVIFGSEWKEAGNMVVWFTPWFILQMISSPVSMVLNITNNQKKALMLHVFGLVLRVGSLLLIVYLNKPFIIEAYAISGYIFYFVYLLLILEVIELRKNDKLKIVGLCLLIGLSFFCYLLIFIPNI